MFLYKSSGWARWISADLGFVYHLLEDERIEKLLQLAGSIYVHSDKNIVSMIRQTVFALEKSAGKDFKLSLRQILRLNKEMKSLKATENVEEKIKSVLEKMLLVKFMPQTTSESFYSALREVAVIKLILLNCSFLVFFVEIIFRIIIVTIIENIVSSFLLPQL